VPSTTPGIEPRPDAVRASSARGAGLVAVVLLAAALAAAISVDVVTAGYGVKSDEATYVAMTLSLAYDHDLTYERHDLERFWGLYRQGPEGIFLKKGKSVRLRVNATPPFVHLTRRDDPRPDRLYYGKAFIYSAFAAPFVRLLGMNGFLVFNVLLLAMVCACGYLFLRARSTAPAAMTFTLAFVGASVVPVYAVYLMPDLFNLACVFAAFFLWAYPEVRADGAPRALWTDIAAAVLLGIATYSKPPNALLAAPLVLLPWWRRRWIDGAAIALAFTLTTAALFGANLIVTGEFNYQGGDRKTFYSAFPFDALHDGDSAPRDVWSQNSSLTTTNDADTGTVLAPSEFLGRFAHNVEYFFVGRHFGFVPYFFPGFVALVAWAFSRDRFAPWRTLTLLSLAGGTLVWLIIAPYSWSGGGGPPGNRYFLSAYPLAFFLLPPLETSAAGIIAWLGGALFTAKILVTPFDAAKRTWEIAEHGAARRLPVELTMVQDLPAMLAQPPRGLIHYRNDPLMELTFLDAHAWPPDCDQRTGQCVGMWISGAGRADIIVKTEEPVRRFAMTARSPIPTTLTISAGAGRTVVPLVPDKEVSFELPASGVRGYESYECLLSAQSSDGFIPHLNDPASSDGRNLGVLLNFRAE
jgi:hypothetical protein